MKKLLIVLVFTCFTSYAQMIGKASYYDEEWNGYYTENDEVFDASKLTCASNTLPFNTVIEVTNLKNGKTVICRVNDRGPYTYLGGKWKEGIERKPHPTRILDLSKASFETISSLSVGIIDVKYKIMN